MKLYKFRSLRPDWAPFADILTQQRLYCADYRALNDPKEGVRLVSSTFEERGTANLWIINAKLQIRTEQSAECQPSDKVGLGGPVPRVCSLSACLDNVLLWSHYADGHRGVAIEIDFGPELQQSVRPVQYVHDLPQLTVGEYQELTAEELLLLKSIDWEYEREYRIIQEEEFFSVKGAITGVYVGSRLSPLHADMLKKLVREQVPIYRV